MNEDDQNENVPPQELENRLLEYAARVIRLTDMMGDSTSQRHVSAQLLRSGTSPLGNHGEAEAAESAADFVHKFKICLKELRETKRWLKLIALVPLQHGSEDLEGLIQETDELEKIFNSGILTAQKRR